MPHVLGAVSLAVNNINSDNSILPNTTLMFKFEPLSNINDYDQVNFFYISTPLQQTED